MASSALLSFWEKKAMNKHDVPETNHRELSEDDIYWLAVEIVQDHYKGIANPLIAKIAERVTEEPIPPGLNEQAMEGLLSGRIAAEVRRMENKASKPIGYHPPRKSEPKFPGSRRSGSLTIVNFSHRDSQGHAFWLALCDCQKHQANSRLFPVRQDHVLKGRVTSCGCHRMRLMRGNRRARKQSGRTSPVEISQQHEKKSLMGHSSTLNLVLTKSQVSAPRTCEHGFKIIKLDLARGDGKARYCELCGLMNDMPAAGSANWTKRLAYENLGMDRGLAPSTDSPTSPKARKFSKTADKVWAAGKNIVLVGGSGDLEITGAVRAHAIISRRRSASGRDKVKPWQNPNVDLDESADAADSGLASHCEPCDPNLYQRSIDRRVAKKPENLFDKQSIGLDDCYRDRDEKALLGYELGEKAIDEEAAETIADDGEDLKGDDGDKSSCDD